MDTLAGIEPQLAIPVILVVLGALLVYIFGFKQTQEPSYEHLAVLQSSSSYKNRSTSTYTKQQTNKNIYSGGGGGGGSAKSNGHVPSSSSTANGGVKKPTPGSKGEANVNKENKRPTTTTAATATTITINKGATTKKENVKDSTKKPEDFESGDWIPAVSRKDKIKKKETPSSPGKKANFNIKASEFVPLGMSSATTTTSTTTGTAKAPRIEDLLAEMNVLKEIEKQNNTSPTDKKKASAVVTPAVVDSPEKAVQDFDEDVNPDVAAATPAGAAAQEKKAANSANAPPKNKSNIAFDEMGGGDSWEEAKSRGTKKRTRTRKD